MRAVSGYPPGGVHLGCVPRLDNVSWGAWCRGVRGGTGLRGKNREMYVTQHLIVVKKGGRQCESVLPLMG
jgi:hypothetical protein